MKSELSISFYLLLICSCLVYGSDLKKELDKAYSKAVTGDISPLLSVFDRVDNIEQSEFAELYGKYKKRFIEADEKIEFEDPFITRLYGIYTKYWRSSLCVPKSKVKAEKLLISDLNTLTKTEGRKTSLLEAVFGPDPDKLETFCIAAAEKKGYHILMGSTVPLCELMIWKKEQKETYSIKLPSESFTVEVVFLQDFLSKGWLGYATFDEKHTGGWHRYGKIYRVGGKPAENDEWFRVSLLGHEGRHISDTKLYGNIDSWILEYRAKLTELLLAEKSFFKLLSQFKHEAQNNKDVPHAYASYQLTNSLINHITQGEEIKSSKAFCFEDYSKQILKEAIEIILDKNTRSLGQK